MLQPHQLVDIPHLSCTTIYFYLEQDKVLTKNIYPRQQALLHPADYKNHQYHAARLLHSQPGLNISSPTLKYIGSNMNSGKKNEAEGRPFGNQTINEEIYVVVVEGIVLVERAGTDKSEKIESQAQVYKGDKVWWTSSCNWHFSKL